MLFLLRTRADAKLGRDTRHQSANIYVYDSTETVLISTESKRLAKL